MSLYNILFGCNSQAALLLATIGLRENDIERFRDVFVQDDGRVIAVYARTGGNNRADYPQVTLYRNPFFARTQDDDYDNTYATFYFNTPEEFVADVIGLSDILTHGLRPAFGAHLVKTLRREPTASDLSVAAYDAEHAEISRTAHVKANGHTFVPYNDSAMEIALKLAETNGGALRTCWGILPLKINVRRDFFPYPNARDEQIRNELRRIEVGYEWKIDMAYWKHCQERFSTKYPITMEKIAEAVIVEENRAP